MAIIQIKNATIIVTESEVNVYIVIANGPINQKRIIKNTVKHDCPVEFFITTPSLYL